MNTSLVVTLQLDVQMHAITFHPISKELQRLLTRGWWTIHLAEHLQRQCPGKTPIRVHAWTYGLPATILLPHLYWTATPQRASFTPKKTIKEQVLFAINASIQYIAPSPEIMTHYPGWCVFQAWCIEIFAYPSSKHCFCKKNVSAGAVSWLVSYILWRNKHSIILSKGSLWY